MFFFYGERVRIPQSAIRKISSCDNSQQGQKSTGIVPSNSSNGPSSQQLREEDPVFPFSPTFCTDANPQRQPDMCCTPGSYLLSTASSHARRTNAAEAQDATRLPAPTRSLRSKGLQPGEAFPPERGARCGQ